MTEDARRAAEGAARNAYGRLLAQLASRSGDIAGAEDALADAFATALVSWTANGVPDHPDAWLLTAARRNIGHRRARAATADAGVATLALLEDERAEKGDATFGDVRLKLMFVCAHPAITSDVQAPLMLQTVLGLDASRIAGSFLVSPAAMSARLVRAKSKIRVARIRFDVPEARHLAARISGVLAAIYAAYGTGWDDVIGADPRNKGLTQEAIWLGRLVAELLPDAPEAMGLLALMLHCEARASTRRDAIGTFVPLHSQDPLRWSRAMVLEAEGLLRAAARHGTPGRFQTEAAIQSLHAQAIITGERLTEPLISLYDLLVALTPTIGARVARAVAYAEGGSADAALSQLDLLSKTAASYQPWWAARARVLWLAGQDEAAHQAALMAAGLCEDNPMREHLLSGALFEQGYRRDIA